jgi:hypothetical protein
VTPLDQAIAGLRFDPVLPLWLLAGLGLVCVLALGVAVWRRARGVVRRGLAFGVLLLWLAGPRLVEETRQTRPDIALLVIDDTASMQIGDRARIAAAAREALAAQGIGDVELRSIIVPEGETGGTRLFGAIDKALADIPRARLSAIIAVTDGQVHDVPASLPAPLHVLIPARGEETDRRVRIVSAPSYGVVGRKVELRAAIDDLGMANPSGGARLTVRRDGEAPETVAVPIGREMPISVPIPRAGPIVVELSAEALPGEASQLNNRAVVTINGVRDRLRVLLVSGEPHVGERTWRRLLKADPAVDLVHFTILRPPEKDDGTPINELSLIAFPVRELFQVKLHDFDLIIMDRFSNKGLLPPQYLRNIAEYVRGGGALLMSAGGEFAGSLSLAQTPLGAVLPARPAGGGSGVAEGAFRPEVARLGLRHPVTADLPGWRADAPADWGQWYRTTLSGAVRGDVLMTGLDNRPLLVVERVGEGRAALLLSDQIWLWSRGHDSGGPQAELLRRVAHWLMKEPELDEERLTASIAQGRLAIQRRSLGDDAAEVTVTDPDGVTTRLTLVPQQPGLAVASLPAARPGVWQVGDGTRSAFAAAGAANPQELEDLRATAEKLGPLARASGGSVHWLVPGGGVSGGLGGMPAVRRTDPGREASGASWIGLPRRGDHVVTGVAALPLLPPGLALPLILGLMVLAWRKEGA